MIMLVGSTTLIFPCHIYFEPKIKTLQQGKEVEVTIYVKLEHRRCDIPLDATVIEAENIAIKEKGNWEKIKKGLYKLNIKIILTAAKGELRVIRECEKKGISEGILEVTAE